MNDPLKIAKRLRRKGWLVVIKFMPKEFSFIIEGARSEYDAPSDDKHVGKGQVYVELMMLRYKGGGWFPQPTGMHTRLDKALEMAEKRVKELEARNKRTVQVGRQSIRQT